MAKKDIAAKVLEKNNDVFADILNVAFFKKDYVKPEELSEAPTEFYYWTQDKEGCRDLRRDVAKVLSKNGKPVAIICIENQSCIDKTMPFRVQEYDGATYLMQLKNSNELPLPVITIVLYFGKRKWRAPLIIKDAISKEHDIPEEISEHIPYYQMNLIEVVLIRTGLWFKELYHIVNVVSALPVPSPMSSFRLGVIVYPLSCKRISNAPSFAAFIAECEKQTPNCAALSIATSISAESSLYSGSPASTRFWFIRVKKSFAVSYSSCTVIGTEMIVSPESAMAGNSPDRVNARTKVKMRHMNFFSLLFI